VGRAGLKREAVVQAAVRIAEAEGIETISMRRVAQDLGVTPMALYRYLPDKDALIDVVVDEALRAVPVPGASGSMSDELLRCFTALYHLLLEHPGLARTAGGRPLEGPVATHLAEGVLAVLQDNGIGEDEATRLLVSAFSLILGFALYRTSRSGRDESSPPPHGGVDAPAVRRVWGRLTAAGADDTVFSDALARLVAGYVHAAPVPPGGGL
jgi:AcrR family transcriptional regulator